MESLTIELRILESLLGAPDLDAKEAVRELAAHYVWLQPAATELDNLPLQEWQAEHNRLFVNGYPTTPCPPFESAYLSGCMQGSAMHDLKDLYLRLGMAAEGAPADYLGTLLECAAYLHAEPEVGRRFWHELWDEHLARWLPRFCRELQHESRLILYHTVSKRLCTLLPALQHALAKVA
jgi:TorA maturation chaperone TorD